MTQNTNTMSVSECTEKEMIFSPAEDVQIVMKSGMPVSVIVPIDEYDKMICMIALAEELLEDQQFDMADGKKGSFQELATERVEADRAEYEAELAAMFADECDEDDDCDQEEN